MSKKPEEAHFLPKDRCPALRTKSLFLNSHYEAGEFEQRAQADVALFWCDLTMEAWGPDEGEVTGRDCRPGRSCWCGDPEV